MTTTHDVRLLQIMSGTLFELMPDSSKVKPSLAASSELSEDGLRYVVKLKEGAKFADGSPLTADDVVATFKRAQSFKSNAYVGQIKPVEAIQALDSNTVEFKFTRPYPSFETFLAYPNMAILKATEIAPDLTVPKTPTFAGPYKFTGDYFSNAFTFERNENFAAEMPAAKTIKVVVVTDASNRIQQVRTGQVDFAIDPLPSQISSLSGNVLPQVTESVGFYYLNMNNKGSALSDPNIRKAIGLAVDRDQIGGIASGGNSAPLSGFFPPAYAQGYSGETSRNVDGAKKLLEGTACANGCDLTLLASEEWSQQAGVVVQQNLSDVGIKVKIESVEKQVEVERLFNSEFDLQLGLFGDYSSAPEGLPAYCMQHSAGYLSCLSGYDSPEAEKAVEELMLALNEADTKQARDKVNELFVKDQPFVTLSGLTAAAAVSESAKGVISVGATNLIHVAKVTR
ncbi:ABC transporter substrate-binding protein [Arthrobacter sp. R4]|uniref:ABC transporter substrate-binding protein n=1 Tax=Arthrobacter sp. R4 TaxID=644417 RepID=UPI003EDA80AA